MDNKIVIGSLEECSLPDLNIYNIEVRIDTGAKTSSLHVDNVVKKILNGKPWITFDIHPNAYDVSSVISCKAPLHDLRRIKSSNGQIEERFVIKTSFRIGSNEWEIEVTLSDRSDMNYLMLLGRQGMGQHVLVDPSQTFLVSSGDKN